MTTSRSLLLLLAALALFAGSCRLLLQEVACLRDSDCPRDVGLGFCDVPDVDGGVGVCVEQDPDPAPDAGGRDAGSFALPDGGAVDAG